MFWWYHHLLECPAHCTGNLASRRICRVAALDREDTFGGIDRQFTGNNLRGICSEKKRSGLVPVVKRVGKHYQLIRLTHNLSGGFETLAELFLFMNSFCIVWSTSMQEQTQLTQHVTMMIAFWAMMQLQHFGRAVITLCVAHKKIGID